MPAVTAARLIVGMEIHVELRTRSKMFTRAPNGAHPSNFDAEPNTLIDPVVLGLPGALPVLNRAAVEMSVRVGLALGCSIARFTKWDRKSYFYPDMPKNYQISQYDLPLCENGMFELPEDDEAGSRRPEVESSSSQAPGPRPQAPPRRIRIIRAHLEEDAGKLLHEWPGGKAIDYSIVDLNRAGTPLLEIVTAPDFTSADEAVAFAQALRDVCRALGVTEGVMQKGHIRFEPNINCELTLDDGRTVKTPIVEVKNLNSFKSLRGAIEYEHRAQPQRWLSDRRELGPGAKTTRGWDDRREETFLQREKEDAHDYRYFPDPDLLPVTIEPKWVEDIRASLPELPHARKKRYMRDFALGVKEATALVEEPETCRFFEESLAAAASSSPPSSPSSSSSSSPSASSTTQTSGTGVPPVSLQPMSSPGGPALRAGSAQTLSALGKLAANLILQSAFKRANERGVGVHELGITPAQVASLARLREDNLLSAQAADELFGTLCENASGEDPRAAAERLGLLRVRDDAALARWVDEALSNPANAQAVADLRAGRQQAIGRLVGDVMKRSGGKADAAAARAMLIERCR